MLVDSAMVAARNASEERLVPTGLRNRYELLA